MTTKKTCGSCKNNCSNCSLSTEKSSIIKCFSCNSKFELVNNTCQLVCSSNEIIDQGKCECINGYSRIDNYCIQEKFYLVLEINHNNELFLFFNESLEASISENSFKIDTLVEKYLIVMQMINDSYYALKFQFEESVKNGTSFELIQN